MKKSLIFLLGLVLGAFSASACFLYGMQDGQSEELERDIVRFRDCKARADAEMQAAGDRTHRALLQMQSAVYGEILASLEQKKSRRIYRILYIHPAEVARRKPGMDRETCMREMDMCRRRIALYRKEAAIYPPGMKKTMAELKVASEEFTLASLERERIAIMYSIPVLLLGK